MTRDGRESLAKIRTLSYILFIFYFVMFFHSWLTKLFQTSETKILFGFIAIIATQIILCTLYIVKFATTLHNDKKKKVTTMIAARVRVFFVIQVIFLAAQAINATVMKSKFIDYGCIFVNILNMIMVLKNLTILQRRSYTQEMVEEASCGVKAKDLKKQRKEAQKKAKNGEEEGPIKKKNRSNKSKKNYKAHLKTKEEHFTSDNIIKRKKIESKHEEPKHEEPTKIIMEAQNEEIMSGAAEKESLKKKSAPEKSADTKDQTTKPLNNEDKLKELRAIKKENKK